MPEYKDGVHRVVWRALAKDVIVAAVVNQAVGDWAVYIGAVPGIKHEDEVGIVRETGSKLPFETARLLFPALAESFEWRR